MAPSLTRGTSAIIGILKSASIFWSERSKSLLRPRLHTYQHLYLMIQHEFHCQIQVLNTCIDLICWSLLNIFRNFVYYILYHFLFFHYCGINVKVCDEMLHTTFLLWNSFTRRCSFILRNITFTSFCSGSIILLLLFSWILW